MKYLIALSVLALSCTKTYNAPTQWDVKIKQSGDTLTAVAYNSRSTNLRYIWNVNASRSEGLTVILPKGRSEVQLSVLDDKGGSRAEYLNVVRP